MRPDTVLSLRRGAPGVYGYAWRRREGFTMWAGLVYDTLMERHVEYIPLSGGAQIFLAVGVQCDFPVGTYLKVTYTEMRGRKLARGIWQADSSHSQETTA